MDQSPAAVIQQYFGAMRAGDPAVAECFHEDAELVGLGTVIRGRPAIDAFYAASISAAQPAPRVLGPWLVEGSRIAVELAIGLADQATIHVMDLFEVEGDKIQRLTYFVSDHP